MNLFFRQHSKFTENVNTYKQNWCYCQSKNFSGTSETAEWQLKVFRTIFNEMPISLLIPCWWFFICLHMYSDKRFLIFTFMNLRYFVKSFSTMYKGQVFAKLITYEQYNFREQTLKFLKDIVLNSKLCFRGMRTDFIIKS